MITITVCVQIVKYQLLVIVPHQLQENKREKRENIGYNAHEWHPLLPIQGRHARMK